MNRRATVVVAVLVVLVVAQTIVAGLLLTGSGEERLTLRRAETVHAFYAAEAGVNMAIRELSENTDEDGDGVIGTISDDANDANDPTINGAQFVVTSTTAGSQTTLVCTGRKNQSRRVLEATIE